MVVVLAHQRPPCLRAGPVPHVVRSPQVESVEVAVVHHTQVERRKGGEDSRLEDSRIALSSRWHNWLVEENVRIHSLKVLCNVFDAGSSRKYNFFIIGF